MKTTKEDRLKALEITKDIVVAEIHNLRDIEMSNREDSLEVLFEGWYTSILNLLCKNTK